MGETILRTIAVIPGLNEARNIGPVVKGCREHVDAVVMVDDGSRDTTAAIAEREGAIVLRHLVNLGKGAALRTGCEFALRLGAERLVAVDSDGQHDPRDIPKLLAALDAADIVFGQRKAKEDMPAVLRFGNWTIDAVIRLLFGIRLADTQCGYRAFTASTYRKIRWKSSDYFVESEMIAAVGAKGISCATVPVKTIYNDKYKGTTIIDGMLIVLNLLYWRLVK
ncbi:glycosyltransferase family 2 protein [Candidatus Woesearchaeota archaeon]|nr:glycosyltransferase family 2 protein [Candidatus Woesearchaeota archaeon]